MHQAFDAHFGRDPGDAARAFRLNGIEVVGAALVEGADAVDHGIGPGHRCTYRRVIANVAENRLHLADGPVGLDEQRLVRATDRDAHAPALFRHAPRDVPP